MLKVKPKIVLNTLKSKRLAVAHKIRHLETWPNEDGSKELRVKTPWGHIAGKKWGTEGGRKVLAIHGWQDNAGTWDTLVPLLNQNLEIFAFDLPGHGKSSHFPKGTMNYTGEYLAVIHRLVKTLSLDKFVYLGHSMGAILGYAYAATFPELVHQYIAIENLKPVTMPVSQLINWNRNAIEGVFKLEASYDGDKKFEGYTKEAAAKRMVEGYLGSITMDSANILLKRGLTPAPSGEDKFVYSRDPKVKLCSLEFGATTENIQRYGSNIKCHVLHIKARPGIDYEDLEIYRQTVRVIRKSAASVVYHEVEGTHHIHLNTPDRVAPLINQFIKT